MPNTPIPTPAGATIIPFPRMMPTTFRVDLYTPGADEPYAEGASLPVVMSRFSWHEHAAAVAWLDRHGWAIRPDGVKIVRSKWSQP
jgi:hypothetical protein